MCSSALCRKFAAGSGMFAAGSMKAAPSSLATSQTSSRAASAAFDERAAAAAAAAAKQKKIPGAAVVPCRCHSIGVPTAAACEIADAARLREAHDALQERCRRNTLALSGPARGAPIPDSNDVPDGETVTAFHSRTVPGLSLAALGDIMAKATATLPYTQWITLILFARYCELAAVPPTHHVMHRLYVSCMHLAVKTHDDRFFSNAHFARLAGVPASEMNALEIALVRGLQWRVLVTSDHLTAMAMSPDAFFASLLTARPPQRAGSVAASNCVSKLRRAASQDNKSDSDSFSPSDSARFASSAAAPTFEDDHHHNRRRGAFAGRQSQSFAPNDSAESPTNRGQLRASHSSSSLMLPDHSDSSSAIAGCSEPPSPFASPALPVAATAEPSQLPSPFAAPLLAPRGDRLCC